MGCGGVERDGFSSGELAEGGGSDGGGNGDGLMDTSNGCGDAWANLCSISCSCCNAFTNAVFKRFVCSALSAFLTFDVTHASQITLGSLPAGRKRSPVLLKLKTIEMRKMVQNDQKAVRTFCRVLFPFPNRRETRTTLRALERFWWYGRFLIFRYVIDHMLETE